MEFLKPIVELFFTLLEVIKRRREVGDFISHVKTAWRLKPLRRNLQRRLRRKYGAEFFIVNTQADLYRRIARVLLATIRASLAHDAESGPQGRPVRVGIVCGPMVYKTAHELMRSPLVRQSKKYLHLVFVAMNRAAESKEFKFSANYLVELLASAFPESKSVAYTANPYDVEAVNSHRQSVDILLCSIGSYNSGPPGYLQIWLDQLNKSSRRSLRLPGQSIGDFCLVPIDASGRSLLDALPAQDVFNCIDPYPRFAALSDLKGKQYSVILPINIERPSEPAVSRSAQHGKLTGKEAVAQTVLQSGIVSTCVLERHLATSLANAVGDYVVETVSKHQSGKPMRLCKALHFSKGNEGQGPYVYDPQRRLDAVCPTDSSLASATWSLTTIPEIIISESQQELVRYDFDRGSGWVSFCVDAGREVDFHVGTM